MFQSTINRLLQKLAMILPGGASLRPWLHRLRGVRVGKKVFIAQFVYLDELHPEAVTIGENCTIGLRTSIFAHFYWGPRQPKTDGAVVIEKDVFIEPHCVILPNVRVGEGAVIKAGTVVSRNVPPRAVWGPPAADMMGVATVPLTAEHSGAQFMRGIRPPPVKPGSSVSNVGREFHI